MGPIVPVVKTNGPVRICGDYKLKANTATTTENYPLPRIEDLLASLASGEALSKLDLSHAYLQLPLVEESQPLVTMNTHKGLNVVTLGCLLEFCRHQPYSNTLWRPCCKAYHTSVYIWMTSWSPVVLIMSPCRIRGKSSNAWKRLE